MLYNKLSLIHLKFVSKTVNWAVNLLLLAEQRESGMILNKVCSIKKFLHFRDYVIRRFIL
jgi:hypothetical protein